MTLYESYSAYPKFDYDQIDELECLAEFRVRKQDITLLADVLQLPVTICCHQRTTCDRTEALCMLLKRFSYPCRYSDMIHRFAVQYVAQFSATKNVNLYFLAWNSRKDLKFQRQLASAFSLHM